jgi:hypothetical protein
MYYPIMKAIPYGIPTPLQAYYIAMKTLVAYHLVRFEFHALVTSSEGADTNVGLWA